MSSDELYTTSSSLSDDKDDHPLLHDTGTSYSVTRASNSLRKHMLFAVGVVLMAGLISSNLLLWHQQIRTNKQQDSITITCGESIEEARANRCQFDAMAYSWTPPPCLNYTHTLEFFERGNWPFWLDRNRTEEVPLSDVLFGKHAKIFSMWSLHVTHCYYTVSRALQVLPSGGPVNDWMRDLNHTSHCLQLVSEQTDKNQLLEISMGFSSCTVVL